MSLNGCYNRTPLRDTAIVQSGWYDQGCTRKPEMVVIDVPMSKTCVYQRDKKDDPKCAGCKHLEN